MDLFENQLQSHMRMQAPLAERMRPQSVEEFMGQNHLMGETKLVRQLLECERLASMILWGPPGVGKTTLAHLLAQKSGRRFVSISAVTSGVKDLKNITQEAFEHLKLYQKQTVLFIDEIHRFNKAQQDFLLPFVERGTLILIGATTENPSFEVISALLSRVKVLTLERLSEADITEIVLKALKNRERGLGEAILNIEKEALSFLARSANGDARSALNALELTAHLCGKTKTKLITPGIVSAAIQKKHLYYDKQADEHYNIISAFIKSMRGSDPNAAIYWMCRMLEAGEDPLFIARRMVIFASEDIGNADPQALSLAVAAMQAVDFVGLPEGRIPLAQAATYLATAPKSNASYMALQKAIEDVKEKGNLEVPLHLRNAPTSLMKELGYSKGAQVTHPHLPKELAKTIYYQKPENLKG